MDVHLPTHIVPAFLIYAMVIGALLKPGSTLSIRTATLLSFSLLAISWLSRLLNWQAVLVVVLAAVMSSQICSKYKALKWMGWTSLFIVPLALALHLVPGFNTITLFGPSTLGLSDLPYTLNANIDKALGALLIVFCFRYWLGSTFETRNNPRLIIAALIAIISLFSLGFYLGVRFDPKFGELTFAFIFFNLFVTCVAEESFFRLLVQRYLFSKTHSAVFAITGSSLIFTLAHFHTGPGAIQRLTLIFLAGVICAWVYQKSNSLLMAILCHFAVNIIHFSVFVYPATFD